MISPTAA